MEIDHDQAWDVLADDPDYLVEQVCEAYPEKVEKYVELDKFREAYQILIDHMEDIEEGIKQIQISNRESVQERLQELGL